jgi:TolB protein
VSISRPLIRLRSLFFFTLSTLLILFGPDLSRTNGMTLKSAPLTVLAMATPYASQSAAPDHSIPEAPTGTVFVSAEREGRWEIYAAAPSGKWEQITYDYSPARSPSLSPDGKQLAFQSHKDGNWEIYVLHLDSHQTTRITYEIAYDGAPSWSPDGKKIAFESYRGGDLDIWVVNPDGSSPFNLTAGEPAYDYGPAWSPDGKWIAYTSWSTGHKQIMLTSPDGGQQVNISQDQFDDEQPAWSPDGGRLAFVSNREGCEEVTDTVALNQCQRREVYLGEFDGAQLTHIRQVTYGGRDSAPAWSPDGEYISFISPRPGRQMLYLVPAAGGIPHQAIVGADGAATFPWVSTAVWNSFDPPNTGTPKEYAPLSTEEPILAPAADGHPYQKQELKEIYLAPSWGQMSSRVANSLRSLRARVKQESGYDFLGTMSDMTRDLSAPCGVSCDNLSWHKAGRAFDSRLEYTNSAGLDLMALVREDQNGETYWRVYIRAAVQDGTMGEPLKDAPWDFSYNARWQIAPGQGGVEKPLPYGYYIDITELAREYGWDRISSHDDPTFDWRSNKLAAEYWHYQKTDGLGWYPAMRELYSSSELADNLDWNNVKEIWQVQDMRLFFKEIPAPPSAWKWFALVP